MQKRTPFASFVSCSGNLFSHRLSVVLQEGKFVAVKPQVRRVQVLRLSLLLHDLRVGEAIQDRFYSWTISIALMDG
jgi:hypothetical protein